MKPANWLFEQSLWNQGFYHVCGLDEVGRGAWAGPVVSAAVVFPPKVKFPHDLFDSKLLLPKRREELSLVIKELASFIGIGVVGLGEINRRGIGVASQMSMRGAIKKLPVAPDYFLVDAFYIKYLPKLKQLPIVKGDQLSASIAAASIVAKVFRDQLMKELHIELPKYRFDLHKGYGTAQHQKLITKHGFSDLHRRSFDLDYLIEVKPRPDLNDRR